MTKQLTKEFMDDPKNEGSEWICGDGTFVLKNKEWVKDGEVYKIAMCKNLTEETTD